MTLGKVADPGTQFRREIPAVVPQNGGRPARRIQQAQQHSNRGRLARTVSAEQTEHATARHVQIERIHGFVAAKVSCELPCLNGKVRHHSSFALWPSRLKRSQFLPQGIHDFVGAEVENEGLTDKVLQSLIQASGTFGL